MFHISRDVRIQSHELVKKLGRYPTKNDLIIKELSVEDAVEDMEMGYQTKHRFKEPLPFDRNRWKREPEPEPLNLPKPPDTLKGWYRFAMGCIKVFKYGAVVMSLLN